MLVRRLLCGPWSHCRGHMIYFLRMDVLTGASTRVAEILDAAGLADDFRVLIGGDQVTAPKPDPGGSELACRQLGLRPADCAYLSEPPTDLEAASRSGALPLAAGWGISISPRTTPAPTSSSAHRI